MNRHDRHDRERGQVMVLTVLLITGILGMAALVLDVGSWFREHRDTQRIADAAALAGAQALPEDPGLANSLAREYLRKNNSLNDDVEISIEDGKVAHDTITVHVARNTPGFFSKVFHIDAVRVGANAAARAGNPNAARWAAPIAVDEKHPFLTGCKPLPCFGDGYPTTLDLEKVGPGAFRILNLDQSHGGTGNQTLADWILTGFDGYMPLGEYYSDPGAKFDSSPVREAMQDRMNSELLFPVYRTIREEGANLEYQVIGWVGFYVTGFEADGSKGKVYGHFTRVIWEGIQSESASNPDFGARSIELIR